MSETIPALPTADLYGPQPKPQPPGLTPLGTLALIMGTIGVITLTSLVAGAGSVPPTRPAAVTAHTPRAIATPPTVPTATPEPTAAGPDDAQVHATVQQETERLTEEVKLAQKSGDTNALQLLGQSSQIVRSPDGVIVTERVIFVGNSADKDADFWAIAQAPDSSGQLYSYTYNSREDRYLVQDPTLDSFSS